MPAIAEKPPVEVEKIDPAKPADAKPIEKPAEKPGAVATSFLERMKAGKEKKAEAKAATPPAPEKPAEAKVDDKPKPKAATPKPVAPAPLDAAAIAEAAGRGVAAEFNRRDASEKPAKAEKADDPLEGLSEKERRKVAVLERMGKDQPDAYATKAKEYIESVRKEKEYQKEWTRLHPGKKFDDKDEEHNDFYAEIEAKLDWDDDDFDEARVLLAAEKATAKASEKGNEKLSEIERKEKLREAKDAIIARQTDTARGFFEAMGEDFAKVMEGGTAEVKRIIEADPLKEVVFTAAQNAEGFAAELFKLTGGLVDFDDKNKGHSFIAEFISDTEAKMAAMPADQNINNEGKRFATAADYNAMPPQKRLQYWRLNDKDLADIYAAQEAARVKTYLSAEEKRIDTIAEKRAAAKKAATDAATNGNGKPPESGADIVEKPDSVVGTVEPRMTPARGGAAGGDKTAVASFLSRLR